MAAPGQALNAQITGDAQNKRDANGHWVCTVRYRTTGVYLTERCYLTPGGIPKASRTGHFHLGTRFLQDGSSAIWSSKCLQPYKQYSDGLSVPGSA